MEEEANKKPGFVEDLSRKWQYVLDKLSPLILYRWILFSVVLALYVLRVYLVNGWYIVTYGLGIYILNQFIGFVSPQFDPDEDMDGGLPTTSGEEFRPFARRLPEFKFWYSCTRATVIGLFMSFFQIFDVPVFWPILLIYFFVLLFVTLKRQINHMIKHKYVPWSWGKEKYGGGGGGGGGGGKKENK